MNHYVYRLDHTETGEFYIGSRSSDAKPIDDNYMGSMKTWKPDKSKLVKTILNTSFNNREEAMLFERNEITKSIKDDLNRNYHIPSVGYHTQGTISVRDKDGNTSKVSVDDPRYLSGELISVSTGMVSVRDKDGVLFRFSVDDPIYLNGDYKHNLIGYITVKDKDGNTLSVSVDDPRYLSGELVSVLKYSLTVKDKDGNTYSVSIDDPRYLSGELVPLWVGLKHSEDTKRTIGEKSAIHQKGSGNSQYGTCWIYNDIESIKIKKDELDDYLSKGWIKGRKMKHKSTI